MFTLQRSPFIYSIPFIINTASAVECMHQTSRVCGYRIYLITTLRCGCWTDCCRNSTPSRCNSFRWQLVSDTAFEQRAAASQAALLASCCRSSQFAFHENSSKDRVIARGLHFIHSFTSLQIPGNNTEQQTSRYIIQTTASANPIVYLEWVTRLKSVKFCDCN